MTPDGFTIVPFDGSLHARGVADVYSPYVTDTDISFETIPPSPDEMRRRLEGFASEGYPVVVALDELGTVAGYAYAHRWKERAAYAPTAETTVYIAPRYCGHRLGHALMERVVDGCRAVGLRSLIACITACNSSSIAFHRALGFVEVSRFSEVGFKHGRFLDVVDMQYML